MVYEVKIEPSAEVILPGLSNEQKEALFRGCLLELRADPRSKAFAIKIDPDAEWYRAQSGGGLTVVYEIDDAQNLVLVWRILRDEADGLSPADLTDLIRRAVGL